jgi:SAM-dependent methyltransferase
VNVFGREYAEDYDALYGDKDYEGEVSLIEQLAAAHHDHVRRVVDFGCGSGGHAIRLAQRGYDVTGVDRSEHMLARAREKSAQLDFRVAPVFVQGDVTSVRLGSSFDLGLMMFAVLGYQVTDGALRDTLATVRAHLASGGLFIADVWYGPAVLATGVSERTKTVDAGNRRIIRSARSELDIASHRVDVQYVVQHVEGASTVEVARETHAMRFFFPDELERALGDAGFTLLAMRAMDEDAPATTQSWNVLFVARAN